ncbi:hypothetical protein JXO52_02775 [bacterium]|nr:hypothetical protein [bacterium]
MLPASLVIGVLLTGVVLVLTLPAVLELALRWRDASVRIQVSLLLFGRRRWRLFPVKRHANGGGRPRSRRNARGVFVKRVLRNAAESGHLLLSLLRRLAMHIQISNVSIAGSYSLCDPAWTGWMAGAIAAAGAAAGPGTVDHLRPDFRGDRTDISVSVELHVRPIRIILVSAVYLVRFLQQHGTGEKRRKRRW